MRHAERFDGTVQELERFTQRAPALVQLASLRQVAIERRAFQPFQYQVRRPRLTGRDHRAHVQRLHDTRRRARELEEQPPLCDQAVTEAIAISALELLGQLEALERDLLFE